MPQFWLRLKSKSVLIFLAIIFLAAGLRLYRLNQIPYGFYWDEAAITYNAWGLAEWNRDEFGNKLPVSFKSFGDYKAPLLIYLLGAIYKLTGLHPEFLRIIISFSGIGVVWLIYLLTKEYEFQKILPKNSALISTFFIAVTPWAVNFSRFGVEAVLALFLFLAGVLYLEKAKQQRSYFFASSFTLVLCMYAYHSAKIVVPLFLLTWGLKNLKILFKSKLIVSLSLIIGALLLMPMSHDMILGSGFERGKSLIFFSHENLLIQNISRFFDLKFWIGGVDAIGLRHGVPGFGVLSKTLFFLFLLGIFITLKNQRNRFFITWSIIGLLPSILATDAPHAIRSMLALPSVLLLATEGFKILKKPLKIIVLSLIGVETCLYLFAYYGSYAINSATAFQYGYKEAILAAEKIADENDKIIVTDFYGQPYIYTLLYRKLTPEEFKFGALANYEFHHIIWPDDQSDRVYVATPEEIPVSDPNIKQIITIPDTTIPTFVIEKN